MWWWYPLLGAVAGMIAGLFGIGGGLVIVPVLAAAFVLQGVAPEVLMHLAIGTSLATIVVTSLSSARAHHERGAVRLDWLKRLLPGLVVGTGLGVVLASELSGETLKMAFGVFVLLVAAKLGLDLKVGQMAQAPGRVGQFVGGSTVGVISSLFGIGGGTVMVPMLSSWQARMTEAVGTAAAAGFPIALTAALTNIVVGWHAPNLPEHAIGYVHWVAWLGIVLVSVPFARLGARLAHALPALLLKRLFALILVVVGLRFLLA
ncbi:MULTISPECIES: sulfite exporter TauE/SafE family protein [unclassified Cobetia]|uniref:sulfite exporter TauE/SafE family protein n=1 Tax=unclassified Cobetia TaxID=2609414 RepID=UPI0020974D36|nr:MULTISPECIES: sulfite exporter TauE/SafE family protein [unclassified Cobetia]MCO7231316.1 sulfite exporter TauE/SafE family protein [Cobetia sp. Dlab-2-AX]MCO7234275.1 sulfite exporter TauE/SafE family protein [Cobetia sp. Dlab-2-U]